VSKAVPAALLVGIELNPGPAHLSDYQRWKIVFLKERKQTNESIAREVKCSIGAVKKVWNRWQETGKVDDRPRSGRKRKLSISDRKKVFKKAKQEKTAPKIAQELKNSGKSVSERTVRRVLKEENSSIFQRLKYKNSQ
jgi:transposase